VEGPRQEEQARRWREWNGGGGQREEKADAAETIDAAPSYHHGVTMCRALPPPARPSRVCYMNVEFNADSSSNPQHFLTKEITQRRFNHERKPRRFCARRILAWMS
jgi:hypothetical protein